MGLMWMVAVLATGAVVPGQTLMLATPAPIFAPKAPGGMAYYIMQGTTIVSAPFKRPSDCTAALAKIKSTQQPGVDTLVCAFRRP
jgi:hypothetical protein